MAASTEKTPTPLESTESAMNWAAPASAVAEHRHAANTLNPSSGYDSNGQITFDAPLGTGIASTPVNGNLSGNPGTQGQTFEAFWIPLQYLRVGVQYTVYSKYNGAAVNYDGLGRNASDNNSLFLYVWAAR